MVQIYNIVKSLAININSSNGSNAVPLFENLLPEGINQADVLSLNGFVKNLRAYAKITSIAEAPLPDIQLEDSQPARINKVLDIEWGNERKELDLLFSADGTQFLTVGTVSLLRQQGYPYKIYNLLDILTDGLASELGQNGVIACRVQNVGYGGLEGIDVVNVFGNWVQEIVLKELPTIYNINVTCNGGGGGTTEPTTGSVVVPNGTEAEVIAAKPSRVVLRLTNTGSTNILFRDESDEWAITLKTNTSVDLLDYPQSIIAYSEGGEGTLSWEELNSYDNGTGQLVANYFEIGTVTFDETDWRQIPENSVTKWLLVQNFDSTRIIDLKSDFYESYNFRIIIEPLGTSPKFKIISQLIFGVASPSTDLQVTLRL